MIASEYLNQCKYRLNCNVVKCSPWGFTHSQTAEVNGKRLLIVGLNANDSDLNIGDPSRDQYSIYLKGLIEGEIQMGAYKCLSNMIQPIARFLYDNDSLELQISALNHLNWCNIISCCPSPNTPRSKPTRDMFKYCKMRLFEDPKHELINRISTLNPTHIVVVGNDAKKLWQQSNNSGSLLNSILSKLKPVPFVRFIKHPSQTSITRVKYWDEVYHILNSKV